MYSTLKYLYILLCVACVGCLLSACSSDIPENPDNGKGTEVTFAVPDQSRASMTTALDRFAVYGDMKMIGENPSSPLPIFNKTEVVKTDNGWKYQDTQYWFPKHEHSFVAVYPPSVFEDENNPEYSNSELSFTYTLPTSDGNLVDDKDVQDIVWATHRRLYNETDGNHTISFHFGHLLSLVDFTLGLNDDNLPSDFYFLLHKLEVKGFRTSAMFSITPAQRQLDSSTDDAEIEISGQEGNGCLVINFAEPIKVTNGDENLRMFDSGEAIIMIPQTFAAGEEMQMTLVYSVNDAQETTEVSATLGSLTWESGKSYNYKIKLEIEQKDVNMVVSKATIAPWNLIDDPEVVEAK